MKPGRLGRFAVAAAAALSLAVVMPTALGAQTGPGPVVMGGVTQPVYGYADAIRERLWVTADFDSDLDGVPESPTSPENLVPGTEYQFDFPLLPEDYVFKAGHRIAFVVVGSYPGYGSQADQTQANITVNITKSILELPVVGGEEALKAAGL